jgi:pyruvate kinase
MATQRNTSFSGPWDPEHCRDLPTELLKLRGELLAGETRGAGSLAEVHETYRDSARNLLHYLSLRRADLRPLQEQLALLGLSSLGRAEPHVLANIDAILWIVAHLLEKPECIPAPAPQQLRFARGKALLETHTEALLGAAPKERHVRIMVTMPGEAADDYALVRELLARGMDCMRVNCAHDGPAAWERMIGHLRRAEKELDKPCRVLMDVAGPKLRTGAMAPGPQVSHWAPGRDELGHVVRPAKIWLTPLERPHPPKDEADAVLPLPASWLSRRRAGQRIAFADPHDTSRVLRIIEALPEGCWAESRQAAWVVPGTRCRVIEDTARGNNEDEDAAAVGALPPLEQTILLCAGDELVLTRDPVPGRPARKDEAGRALQPARIACSLPEVFGDVKTGEPIWLDDGKIGGQIESVNPNELHVRITRARPQGSKLRADKGINLPASALRLPALTAKDAEDLSFVVRHANVIGYSFVNSPEDVILLQKCLAKLDGERLGILLKIETRRAFLHLPNLLLTAMRSPCVGVMIARGDLGVECGFERLAEVQEEILWICEAAHVPVVWATQVLETLAKKGLPSRAEITDAAMGERAECVMLNKGPHVAAAVCALDDILKRMAAHQFKKRSMLRPLSLASHFTPGS